MTTKEIVKTLEFEANRKRKLAEVTDVEFIRHDLLSLADELSEAASRLSLYAYNKMGCDA